MIPDGEYQAVPIWSLTGDPEQMSCVLGIIPDVNSSFSSVSAMCQNVSDALVAAQVCNAASMASGWTFLGVRGYQRVGSAIIVGEFATSIAGTGTWENPPNNCSVLWRKVSATPGRAGRGRMYLPPFSVDEIGTAKTGVLSTGFVAGQVIRADALLVELAARETVLTIQHADGSPSTPVTRLVPQNQLATQRRRMRR